MKITIAFIAAVVVLSTSVAEGSIKVFETKGGDEVVQTGDVTVTVHHNTNPGTANTSGVRGRGSGVQSTKHRPSNHHTTNHHSGVKVAKKGKGHNSDDDDDDREDIVCGILGSDDCAFEPSNPVTCEDGSCPYENYCEADLAGYDPETCCDAPNPAACPSVYDPYICGRKQCFYDNLCVAELAGYSDAQCCPLDTYDSGSCVP